MRSSVALMFVVLGVYSTGCSFIFTKGPQPELQPPPQCTTSNVAPILDSTGAALSGLIGLISLGGAACSGDSCYWNKSASAWTAVAFLATAGLLTTSAVVGFNRTAACRSSLGIESPASSPLPESSLLLVPQRNCPTLGDAPRLCTAVALDEALQ